MVNNYSKNRFEEVVHEKNELESPNIVRKKELASIVLRQLEEEREDYGFGPRKAQRENSKHGKIFMLSFYRNITTPRCHPSKKI